jgi:hypothetical protein
VVRDPHWIVYQNGSSVYAFDMDEFVDSEPVELAAASTLAMPQTVTWSPDANHLLQTTDGVLYAQDMDGASPGAARRLTDHVPVSWSADSESLLVKAPSAADLFTLAVSQATPTLHPLPQGVGSFHWAPVGGRGAYADATGVWTVDVTAGVPGQPQIIAPAPDGVGLLTLTWSPDGSRLAIWQENKVMIVTAEGAKISEFEATVGAPKIVGAAFSADSAVLAFMGHATRQGGIDVYTVSAVDSEIPATPYPPLPGNELAEGFAWHPTEPSLLYWFQEAALVSPAIATFSGSSPAIRTLPLELREPRFVLGGTRVIGRHAKTQALELVDPVSVADPPLTLTGATSGPFAVSSAMPTLAYGFLRLDDLLGVATPAEDLNFLDATAWRWSPSGRFIALQITSGPEDESLELLWIEGTRPSAARTLVQSAITEPAYAWQPAPR